MKEGARMPLASVSLDAVQCVYTAMDIERHRERSQESWASGVEAEGYEGFC